MARLDELTIHFHNLTDTMLPRAPFAASVCSAIADEPDLVELLLAAPREQQDPVLLLAALHDHVLGQPDCELAQWYPTVTSTPRGDDVRQAVARHCRRYADQLRHTVSRRNTQTNEVGRCAFFLPALGLLADETGPLALVDVGTSGALNLRLDRYEYHYLPGGSVGGPSPVRFETGTRGPVPVPQQLPVITSRIGLDQHPIDVTDERAARWLTACIWPDQTDRFDRLRSAIAIAHDHPVDLRQGDAVDDLADAVTNARTTGHPVVLNSWVLNYLPADRRVAYLVELERLGHLHDLSWVFAESPARTVGLPFPDPLAGEHVTALMLVRWRDGVRSVHHLGVTHPHGYWLHWVDTTAIPTAN